MLIKPPSHERAHSYRNQHIQTELKDQNQCLTYISAILHDILSHVDSIVNNYIFFFINCPQKLDLDIHKYYILTKRIN